MNYEDTLSELKAIQASYSPTPFLLDPDAEPRFLINSDERTIMIPEEFKFLAVKMDHLSERIYFEIPRYFDGEDLATKICVVQYINANGEEAVEGIAAITDVDYESEAEKIIFRWDVDNNVTKYAGDVSFSVRFYTISDDNRFTYSWNTIPSTLPILDTIDNTGNTVTENYPTELILWQYRMQELDKTISDKISEATASLDADIETGQSLVTAAQAARKGAEDAEGRVNAIVAGNEAYTKQQSHDLFALALKGTAEAAKSVTIYPDKGSNVVATIHGFTKQEGEGDASPNNVRALTNGGMKLVQLALTGAENWAVSSAASGQYQRFYMPLSIAAPADWKSTICCTEFIPKTILVESSVNGIGTYSGTLYLRWDEYNNSVDLLKADLSARYAAGDPVTVWYVPADESDATGLYAPLTGTGDGYTGICRKLTAPLCQGDKFITKVKSGCDKVMTFDGSSDEDWKIETLSGGTNRYYIVISNAAQADMETGFALANWLKLAATGQTGNPLYYNIFTITADNRLYVRANNESLADFKLRIAADPLTIWYRSTDYTNTADNQASIETHVRWKYTFTGKEGWTVGGVGAYLSSINLPGNKTATSGKCSHFKYQYSYTANAIMVESSGRVALGTAAISELGFSGVEDWKAYLAEQYAAGTPVEVEYELATQIVFAHDPVDFIASPDEDGTWVITGETDGTVSAEYNKNITKAFEDIVTRLVSVEKAILGG